MRLSGELGSFRVDIIQQPGCVDEERCIACGLCTEVCPTDPRAIHPASAEATPFLYVLDEGLCLHFKGQRCDLCQRTCPTKAIEFKVRPKEQELSVDAIIVATGFDVSDARAKGSLGYGRYPNVLTGLDLEQVLSREGYLRLPTDGREPKNIAFIQCVGSRDTGHGYCSQVCCKYAMKLAGLIKYQNPDGHHHQGHPERGARAPDNSVENIVLPLGGAEDMLLVGRPWRRPETVARYHIRIRLTFGCWSDKRSEGSDDDEDADDDKSGQRKRVLDKLPGHKFPG